eukprot:484294-Rhodomonas_salina.1
MGHALVQTHREKDRGKGTGQYQASHVGRRRIEHFGRGRNRFHELKDLHLLLGGQNDLHLP